MNEEEREELIMIYSGLDQKIKSIKLAQDAINQIEEN